MKEKERKPERLEKAKSKMKPAVKTIKDDVVKSAKIPVKKK